MSGCLTERKSENIPELDNEHAFIASVQYHIDMIFLCTKLMTKVD